MFRPLSAHHQGGDETLLYKKLHNFWLYVDLLITIRVVGCCNGS